MHGNLVERKIAFMKSIYVIRNKINDKVYVGQSNDLVMRWYHHISETKLMTDKMPIHEAMREFGIDCFYQTFPRKKKCSIHKTVGGKKGQSHTFNRDDDVKDSGTCYHSPDTAYRFI